MKKPKRCCWKINSRNSQDNLSLAIGLVSSVIPKTKDIVGFLFSALRGGSPKKAKQMKVTNMSLTDNLLRVEPLKDRIMSEMLSPLWVN